MISLVYCSLLFLYNLTIVAKNKRNKNKQGRQQNFNKLPKFDLGLAQETVNGIWGVVSFALAVITALAFFHKAGPAGELFTRFAKSLFGWGIFLIPVALILIGIAFFKSISRKIYASLWIGITLFLLSFLAVFYIFGDSETAIIQGGYLGVILGYPLSHFLGFAAALIILIVLLVVSVIVVLDIPIHALFVRKTEEEKMAEEAARPLQDKVVIKRGNEIVNPQTEELEHKKLKAQAAAAPKKSSPKDDEEREFVIKASRSGAWTLPPIEILHSDKERPAAGDINASVGIIKRTLGHFGIDVEMGEVSIGPTVTQFTLRPAVGVKLSKITALNPDLSLALAAHPIRIEAPIPGKSLVGIEVPNKKSAIIGLRDLIDSEPYRKGNFLLPLCLGRDVAGFPVYAGVEKMPHLLVAGATGTGKSVAINSILLSMLYRHSPNTLRLILIDPKRVELTLYNSIPHLITPVITDAKKVVNALRWAVKEMDKRYERLQTAKVRDILSYNAKQAGNKEELMPYIVVVIDELADIMAAYGRDVEAAIVRLAQMSRAVGIHLIVSTQRPSVEVITGLIKANITSRIAFQVASQVDSRTILDAPGAEKLLGNGDMLYQGGDTGKLKRIQGAFVSEKEVKDVIKFIKQQGEQLEEAGEEPTSNLDVDLDQPISDERGVGGDDDTGDDLYEEAKNVVTQAGKASASLLQRRLKVGYARAARLLDMLEERGIIGPGEGAKPREVFVGGDRPLTSARPPGDYYEDDGSTPEVVEDDELDRKIALEE